ncbi:hypothetical protein ART_1393 [Arthrobacter sp. PAMC 25486]|uniref:DUF4956 domain-containing protein n=1 Tax=Arthrobacter sp. PAMC 25486 TaxID=1494608 RepID=UPI000535FB57|nr:DUF4956 domain-containing protein [Arthrobacter sp. PAMC 25486]AIY00992.1 hypothetical protein ART_1393 [Arthrobacter sp. PAMC 25486]
MFNLWIALAANMICISVLVYAVYFPRYQRRDLAIAYVCLNVGIMLVTMLLSGSGAGMGLGLGLFGVLSIIRLRSDTLTQGEIGYYFAALVLGLMNGLHPDPAWLSPVLSAALVAVLFVADHPRIAPRTRRQTITLDRAYANEGELRMALETLLGGPVTRIELMELDIVRDLTIADVRYKAATTAPVVPCSHEAAAGGAADQHALAGTPGPSGLAHPQYPGLEPGMAQPSRVGARS